MLLQHQFTRDGLDQILKVSDSNEDVAQTFLHVLLSDDDPNHSGTYFCQANVIANDSECKAGGWPMEDPNPNAKDMEVAKKLVEMSYGLVGLEKK